jgi:hypothetical protein
MASASACTAAAAPALSWPERFIMRREAARAFLVRNGQHPCLLTTSGRPGALNSWRVTGWTGAFDDHELIALAEHQGWEG